MVATRDIGVGEIVLLDRAVVVAPQDRPGKKQRAFTEMAFFKQTCMNCHFSKILVKKISDFGC